MNGFISPRIADFSRSDGEDNLSRLVFLSRRRIPIRARADVAEAIESMWRTDISPRQILNAVGIVAQNRIAIPA